MSCDEYRALISDAMDTDLPPEKEKELNAHLRDCEECRAYAETLKEISAELRKEPTVPPELRERVMSAVREEARRKKLRRLKRYGSLAACVVLALGLGFFAGGRGAKSAQAPMTMMAADSTMMKSDAAPAAVSEEECAELPMEEPAAAADSAGFMMANSWTPDAEAVARDALWNRDEKDYGECRTELWDALPDYEAVYEDYEPVGEITAVIFEAVTVLVDEDMVAFGFVEG